MVEKLDSIKEMINDHKADKGAKAKFPTEVWIAIKRATEEFTLKDICNYLEISYQNALKKLKALENNGGERGLPKIIQLPHLPTPTMEMVLPSGTIIKVYSV